MLSNKLIDYEYGDLDYWLVNTSRFHLFKTEVQIRLFMI